MNATTLRCHACAEDIRPGARICPQCGVDQRPVWRAIKRGVATLSALSVLLGVITIAISLAPQAWNTIAYREAVDIYSYKPLSSDGRSTITLINTGRADLFINEISLKPKDEKAFTVTHRKIVINRWLKIGETITYRPRGETPGASSLSAERYADYISRLSTQTDKGRRCFGLRPFDQEFSERAFPELPTPPLTIDLVTSVRYGTKASTTLTEIAPKKELRAGIIFRQQCEQFLAVTDTD